jgi:general L-amino acid transport system permease protein
MVWLVWGGSIWGRSRRRPASWSGSSRSGSVAAAAGTLAGVIAAIVVPILYWLFLAGPLAGTCCRPSSRSGSTFVPSDDFGGFMLSFIIGIAGIILSLPLGMLLALGRQSDLFIINKVSVAFIEIIRGVPLIVWLFTASLLLNYFLPPGTNFDLMLRVIIMVTLFASAYIAEVVRGGLAALPRASTRRPMRSASTTGSRCG